MQKINKIRIFILFNNHIMQYLAAYTLASLNGKEPSKILFYI